MKRRGFLLGAGASAFGLVAMPAVARVAPLMRIVPLTPDFTYGPNGVLSFEMIANELARQIALQGVRSTFGSPRGALQIAMQVPVQDRALSLQEYSARLLQPAAKRFAEKLAGKKLVASKLQKPAFGKFNGGPEMATGKYAGLEVSAAKDYDIITDSLPEQFTIWTE